ncbi:dTDP-4-dehydrorhamnose 3,5-epimerase [Sphingomonas bisphenolicum]|uniref:dTDP-4-dehydrorhamnose 3,5-epimerase n=1 Tax=Sphingomonas bisphenolicum TaxID=296544 RepID=A0ABN5WI35_9SPHN|nr:dTDP-4-dehydrorhamnose 3,5-epimerase [Sphingomonas bisphenolicum]BBF71430.1 dTDP-4-dehydrorhamnose 3,5-epimerase [Sphingomonas bisphenolicum]
MKVIPTGIAGLAILEPRLFQDDRGFFMESWNSQTFRDAGLDLTFVQDNHSRSDRGVLRGLHFQHPNPQGKLVRVTSGSVWDVAVDLRRSSATFGRWFGVELSAANKRMFWIPPGFAHGFLCLEDGTDFLYKCTAFYQPAQEHSLLWNDPALNIPWPVAGMDIQLSAKDRDGLPLAHIQACD